jgi:hypothetical protein
MTPELEAPELAPDPPADEPELLVPLPPLLDVAPEPELPPKVEPLLEPLLPPEVPELPPPSSPLDDPLDPPPPPDVPPNPLVFPPPPLPQAASVQPNTAPAITAFVVQVQRFIARLPDATCVSALRPAASGVSGLLISGNLIWWRGQGDRLSERQSPTALASLFVRSDAAKRGGANRSAR